MYDRLCVTASLPLEEIMGMGEWSEEEVQKALELVQTLDPIGVGARNLTECLLIQIRHLGLEDEVPEKIITDHLDLLRKRRYDELAKKLGCSLDTVNKWVEIIKDLDPKPGDKYNSETSYYVVPDVYVV